MKLGFDTARCIVRPFRDEDIDAFMEYRNDGEWMKYQGFKCLSRQAYHEALLCPCDMEKGVQLAVIRKLTGALIGDLYLKQEGSTCWIGYTIHPKEARQGYMYEVVSAAIGMMGGQGIHEIRAGVSPENLASVSLLKKLDFVLSGTEGDELVFHRCLG